MAFSINQILPSPDIAIPYGLAVRPALTPAGTSKTEFSSRRLESNDLVGGDGIQPHGAVVDAQGIAAGRARFGFWQLKYGERLDRGVVIQPAG